MTDFLFDGPEDAPVRVLLAHGAGAAMDSGTMTAAARALAASGAVAGRPLRTSRAGWVPST